MILHLIKFLHWLRLVNLMVTKLSMMMMENTKIKKVDDDDDDGDYKEDEGKKTLLTKP